MKNESIECSWIPGNNTSYYKNFDYKENNNSKDNMKIIDNNEDILDIDVFTKLLKAA